MPDTTYLIATPLASGRYSRWGSLVGASASLAFAELARQVDAPLLVLADDPRHADQLDAELRFFSGGEFAVLHFVEWETLPWDNFSPHQDIISQRLSVLAQLPSVRRGIVIASAPALLQRLPPLDYVAARSLSLRTGQQLPHDEFTASLAAAGYLRVPQVSEHGEFAVRGSLIDVFPMGSDVPVRIDFFDDEIESLRYFSAESQLSGDTVDAVELLPAREVPLDDAAIRAFRSRYRERFEGQPSRSRVYRDVSEGIAHGGIEYYLPLFFEHTSGLADYLPDDCIVIRPDGLQGLLERTWAEIEERHELCSLDPERPVLDPSETFAPIDTVTARLDRHRCVHYSAQSLADAADVRNLPTRMPPALKIEARYEDPAGALVQFLESFDGRVLFTTDSAGRLDHYLKLNRVRRFLRFSF